MKDLLVLMGEYRRDMNRVALFSLLVILLLCRFNYSERQISQFGITWNFNKDYNVGQFANGEDYGDLFNEISKSGEAHPLLGILRVYSGSLCVFLGGLIFWPDYDVVITYPGDRQLS